MNQFRQRGRPRTIDEGRALDAVLGVFWTKGYAASSLDDLSAAAQVARPSLYAAFGDKKAMYLRSLGRFEALLRAELARSLVPGRPVKEGLLEFYQNAIELYLSGEPGPRGCLIVCTAPASALDVPEVRRDLARVLATIDSAFEFYFKAAASPCDAGVPVSFKEKAKIAASVVHSLALRARAGASRRTLRALASAAVALLECP